jgi:hypothetical protein
MDSVFAIIAILILSVFGFVFYALARLIIKGFQAAIKQDWDKAFSYWFVPGFLMGLAVLLGVSFVVTALAKQEVKERQQIAVHEEIDWVNSHPEMAVNIARTGDGPIDVWGNDHKITYGEYDVENMTTHLTFYLNSDVCYDAVRGIGWGVPKIPSGEIGRAICIEHHDRYFGKDDVKVTPCIELYNSYLAEWNSGLERKLERFEICVSR